MHKIVIVEDEEALARVLKEKFESEEFEVELAMDGKVALPIIQKMRPDLVLLDLMLPKRDGIDVLKDIKADRDLESLPVIVLSNLDGDEDIKQAISLGAKDYFVKSQHPIKEVVEKVKDFLINPQQYK
ncbi:MAG: Response regulator [Candidatus Wolfebacteria bacterium GW2011_GWC2_46_275]|uniref:Response regulator n=2 Tax=Candidatus Wolfeibacteriota TaxID=1752735 RepID=A0A0G1X511_9BACT|nr:MAG: Alkaline phosphatase synthesis transcriptional regulatory protein PhoP, two-component system, OmpR family, alkaline phosphatase synthesis response regulator PhoP [Candidatus Wolfebacteria bacterium GW2011_GWB1_47_1]KKU36694.1 MAG: Response regulator [Candidatus Wolfebacteria bacterium GW2011_GWC2_46_275]KKU54308.1 MAG: Response regulator [Candidatus Wolfebacteria bacterium GW2011_GWC1_47_103]KKU72905.1 MAG: Response regulator [Candidatus Wolfebacteria bacterium GW2011_GWB1_47_243]KKU895